MRLRTFVTLLLLVLPSAHAGAQWRNVAPNLLAPFYTRPSSDYGGATCFKDGILWCGKRELWMSPDSGRTWTKKMSFRTADTFIVNIDFYDAMHGVVSTQLHPPMLTSDGGNTWRSITFPLTYYYYAHIVFLGSAQVLAGRPYYGGQYYISRDAGMTWGVIPALSQSTTSVYGLYTVSGPNGLAYSQTYTNPTLNAQVERTTDYGQTWTTAAGVLIDHYDSYSLAIDRCDPDRVYLLNEDGVHTTDGLSSVEVSSDQGDTWRPTETGPTNPAQISPAFVGWIVTSDHAVYVQTRENGLIRSTDHGMTWKNIGGPNIGYDTRSIATASDNIVFAIDSQGSVWRTDNSGGDPVNSFDANAQLHLSAGNVVSKARNVVVELPIYMRRTGSPASVDFIMHYPTDVLSFLSSATYAGAAFDVAGDRWDGRVHLRLDSAAVQAAPDSLFGNIKFLWAPYEVDCAKIRFDSLSSGQLLLPCSEGAIDLRSFDGSIGTSVNCLTESAPNHTPAQAMPVFIIRPNPAQSYVTIRSSQEINTANVTIFDELGKHILSRTLVLGSGEPARIDLGGLSAGSYYIRIEYGGRVFTQPLVIR